MKHFWIQGQALAAAIVLTAAVASADSSAVPSEETGGAAVVAPRLEWIRESGAESCVTAKDLATLLSQVLGENAAPSALGDSSIEGLVSRGNGPNTWVARIRIVSQDGAIVGKRELSTRQPLCSALTPSVLLVLLMLVDPEAAERGLPTQVVEAITNQADAEANARTESTVPSTAPAPPPTLRPKTVSSIAAPRPRSPSLRGVRLHVEPTLNVGLLPSVTAGMSAGASLVTRDSWQLALLGSYGGRAKVDVNDPYALSGGFEFSALVLDLSVCPVFVKRSTWELSGCVGATFVRRTVDTPALTIHADPVRHSLGPSIGLATQLALTEQWYMRGDVSAAMPIPREEYVYQDRLGGTHSVYTPSRLWGTVGVGLGVQL